MVFFCSERYRLFSWRATATMCWPWPGDEVGNPYKGSRAKGNNIPRCAQDDTGWAIRLSYLWICRRHPRISGRHPKIAGRHGDLDLWLLPPDLIVNRSEHIV